MKIYSVLFILVLLSTAVRTQSPIRVGTTTAEFLGIGYGPAASGVGDAYVSLAQDVSSIYWNPAGLSFMEMNQVMFTFQPWIVDISTYFSGAALVLPRIGTIGIGFIGVNYGEMEVTTVDMQQGTGEYFNAGDYAVSLSYARKLAQWFGFGASVKYIRSTIWHTSANALALDLGVMIQTPFFSVTGENENGLRIGMNLSNYGSRMSFSGIDLLGSVDISPDEAGNYKDVKVYYATDAWE
ncbi:MAG: PorV/PorQ family protein, partial [Calditrichaeota bacterium]